MITNGSLLRACALVLAILLMPSGASWAQEKVPAANKLVIESIRFEGAKEFDDKKSADEMRAMLGSKPMTLFNEDIINDDVNAIERRLSDRGYPYAKIEEVRGRSAGNGRVNLTFVINSGDLYHVSEIKITGNHAFSVKQIAPKTHLTVGQIYCSSDISEDKKMIHDFYGARGYADVAVETSVLEVGKGSVRLQHAIDEGKKSLLNEVHVSGNNRIRQEDIRKEFKLAAGDVYNTVLIEQGRQALLKTGLFESVETEGSAAVKAGFKDLKITVVEK